MGNPLEWYTSKLSYGFNVRGFPGLTDAQLRSTFAASFATWAAVRCNDKSIGLNFTALPGTTTLEQGPMSAEPNENTITHYDVAGWSSLGYSPSAFAITAVWFEKSGQILGADIGFNGGMDLYGDCTMNPCTSTPAGSTGVHTDLQNVATHEIGHYLGLSHSDVDGSTMSCDAHAYDTDLRTLADDDIAGICAAYPPGNSFPDDYRHSGCSVQSVPAESGYELAFFGVASAILLARRRRR